MDHVRRDLAALLAAKAPPVQPNGTVITADSTIFGEPTATPEQAVAAILTRKPHASYTPYDITVIVGHYYRVTHAVGVNPEIPIGQMMHQTGTLNDWHSLRPNRNPAVIGVEHSTMVGVMFGDWPQSVQAQVGRLLAYFTKREERTPAEQDLVALVLRYRDLTILLARRRACDSLSRCIIQHNAAGRCLAIITATSLLSTPPRLPAPRCDDEQRSTHHH